MKREIRVFIASPGDLVEERVEFKKTIESLNKGFGDSEGVEFIPLGWEDTLACTGRRSQGVINIGIDKCDIFFLVMYKRWGQEAPDANPYSSYTEEEFYRALERWKVQKAPEICVLFKRVDILSEANPEPQLEKVIQFRRQLQETHTTIYRIFDDTSSFRSEIEKHLRAYTLGEWPKVNPEEYKVLLPQEALEEVKMAKEAAREKSKEADFLRNSADNLRLELEASKLETAEDAANLSKEGKTEFARQKFLKLVMETENLKILYLGFEFFYRTGDYTSAFFVLNKWLRLSGPNSITHDTAIAHLNLGVLYDAKGDFENSENSSKKAQAIFEAINDLNGLVKTYVNLGNIYQARGNLEQAGAMYIKALPIFTIIKNQKGIATCYGNLGIVYMDQGIFNQSEIMFKKSLDIYSTLNDKQGIAICYTNLALVYQTCGNFDRSIELYKQALEIEEILGNRAGIAGIYGSLGMLYQKLGDFHLAEEMYKKSLQMEETLGRKYWMASCYEKLGNLYQILENLDFAENMYIKAIRIEEVINNKQVLAGNYSNIGSIYMLQGKCELAEKMYTKAYSLFSSLSNEEDKAKICYMFGILYMRKGDNIRAQEQLILAKSINHTNINLDIMITELLDEIHH